MTEPNETSEPSGASGGSLANAHSARQDAEAKIIADGIAEIMRIASEPDWIPVTERLPVDIPHGYCLVTDGENVGTANYSTTANKFDHCIDRDYWTPTHWMPLPAPPTDAK